MCFLESIQDRIEIFKIFINVVKTIVFRCLQDSKMIGFAHALRHRQIKMAFVKENEKRKKEKRKACVKEICKILEIIIYNQSVKSL